MVTRRAAQPAPVASAPAQETVAKAKVDPELEARKKKTEQEQSDKRQGRGRQSGRAARRKLPACASHMATLDSGIRLTRTNEKGEREILDDKQAPTRCNRTRQIISSDCR